MIFKITQFDSSGKQIDKPIVIYDCSIPNQFRGTKIQREANGGVSISLETYDEFGHDLIYSIHLDKSDLQQINEA